MKSANLARSTPIHRGTTPHYANAASSGAAENHYRTMDIKAIADLPVAQLATDHAHLHLWTTNAFLFEAQRVIEAWGFVYKSRLI